MDTLLHRKAALFTLAAVYTGFCAAFLSDFWRTALLIGTALLYLLSILPWQKRVPAKIRTLIRIILAAVLTGAMLLSSYVDGHIRKNVNRLDGTSHSITATVVERMYETAYSVGYKVKISRVNDDSAQVTVLLETPATDLSTGDLIQCAASFTEPDETDGTFPLRRYYASQGIVLCAESENVTVLDTGTMPLQSLFTEWRENLTAALRLALGRADAALPAALLLGDRSYLPESLTRDFQRLGISHLLAISGFHFAILLGAVEKLLAFFIPNRKLRLIPLAALAVLYMLLCSMAPSVLRAGIMMLIAYTAVAFNRTNDMPTALGVAVFLICLFDPAQFYSAALHLSATAVLAIACYSHIVRTYKKDAPVKRAWWIWRKILTPILLALCIQWALLPFLCQYFGEISLLAPITTVLFSPLIATILSLTPLLLLFHYIPFIATPLSLLLKWLGHLTADLAEWMAGASPITVSLHQSWAPYFALAIAALFLLTPLLHRRKQIAFVICAILTLHGTAGGLIVAERILQKDHAVITETVKGTNEAILVMENGKTLLCDISNGSYSAINYAYSHAKKSGATELDILLLTHLHKRHITSFDRISDTAYVRMLILPEPETEAEENIVLSLQEIAENKNIPVRKYTRGNTSIEFCGNTIRIDTATLSRSTHPTITMHMTVHGHEIAYIGASAAEAMDIGDTIRFSTVIFGTHGPIYKQEFENVPIDASTRIIFRGNSYDFASEHLRSVSAKCASVISDDTVRLRLTPSSSKDS